MPADPHPARSERQDHRPLLQRIAEFIHPGPDSREELIASLAQAEASDLIGADARKMLEGVIRMAEQSVRDVMVPAPHMDMVDIDQPFEALLHSVIDTGHSRFPVYAGERENIIGILLAKDLLKRQRAPEIHLRALLRPAVFVPESKGLNDILRDFQSNHNHLAIVIDEFGRVAGLVTIEDVLEQIVGEIEDEFDQDHDSADIFSLGDRVWRVRGDAELSRLEDAFDLSLQPSDADEHFETIGGLIAHAMGHVPRRGERHRIGALDFVALHTQGGAVTWFRVSPAPAA